MEGAFQCNKTDIEEIFDKLSAPCRGDAESTISSTSLCQFYGQFNEELSEESIQQGLNKFLELYCHTSLNETKVTKEMFYKGVDNFSVTLQAEGKTDEKLKEIFDLVVHYANNDPRTFSDMLNLPPAVTLDEIEELMRYLTKS